MNCWLALVQTCATGREFLIYARKIDKTYLKGCGAAFLDSLPAVLGMSHAELARARASCRSRGALAAPRDRKNQIVAAVPDTSRQRKRTTISEGPCQGLSPLQKSPHPTTRPAPARTRRGSASASLRKVGGEKLSNGGKLLQRHQRPFGAGRRVGHDDGEGFITLVIDPHCVGVGRCPYRSAPVVGSQAP